MTGDAETGGVFGDSATGTAGPGAIGDSTTGETGGAAAFGMSRAGGLGDVGVVATATSTGGADVIATGAASPSGASAFFFPLVGAASSGCTSRLRPSRSALRRARSACASSILEEWLFTPMPSTEQRSSISLLVSPSSRASS